MSDPDAFHAAVLTYAELAVWSGVAIGFILCFAAGIWVAKAVW